MDYITTEQIQSDASIALHKYYARYGTKLPIRAEEFLETEFGVHIMIIPIGRFKLECSTNASTSVVHVDETLYNRDGSESRLRFGFAHEIGHIVLHKYSSVKPENLTDKQYRWREAQANRFASFFVMPTEQLLMHVGAEIIKNYDLLCDQEGLTFKAFALHKSLELSRVFGVSQEALEIRLKGIEFEQLFGSPYITVDTLEEMEALVSKTRGLLDAHSIKLHG